MDGGTAESGVVLQLSSSDGWAVVGDDDKLRLTSSHGLDGVSITFRKKRNKVRNKRNEDVCTHRS